MRAKNQSAPAPTANDSLPSLSCARVILRRWAPGMLLFGAAWLYLFRLGRVALYDNDESVYAEICREMLAFKSWFTPLLNSVPYLEKPPLLYWLNGATFKVLGITELSARLPTALAAVAGVGCVYRIGRNLWGRQAGIAAGAILATSFGYFVFGRMMMPDMLFTVLVTGAFWAFGRALLDESASRAAVLGGYAAMGGAVLAKGVIGLVFPALAVGAFVLLEKDWQSVRRLEIGWGGAVFLLIVVPWHALMEWRYPGFLRYYLVEKHLYRFLGHPELLGTVSLPVPTYLVMTLVWFCPWSVFLPAAIHRCWPRIRSGRRADRASLLVFLWAGSVVGFFALSASRLEYYALPALPAFALLVGRIWEDDPARPRQARVSAGLRITWLGLIAFVTCLAPVVYFFPRLEHLRFYNLFPIPALPAEAGRRGILATAKIYDVPGFSRLVPLLELVVALILGGTVLSACSWFLRRPRLALACLAGTMGIALTVIQRGFLLYAPYRSVAVLAAVLRNEFRPGDRIMIEGPYEHHAGIAFYTGQHIDVYRGMDGLLMFGTRYAGIEGTFIGEEDFARAWDGAGRVYLLSDASDCLERLHALTPGMVILGRTGNSWLIANRAAGKLTDAAGLLAATGE